MGRLPPSLVHAVRDVGALIALALVSGTALASWCAHVEAGWWAAQGVDVGTWSDLALSMGRSWTLRLAPFVLVVWCAGRARSRARSRWLPLTAALLVVVGGAAATLVPGPGGSRLIEAWPGPDLPFLLGTGRQWDLGWTPAWGYPVLAASILTVGAVLGVRDGQGLDDRASTALAPVPPGGGLLTLGVVGVPGATATVAAVATALWTSRVPGTPWWTGAARAAGPLLILGEALLATALVSGTGPVGMAAAALAGLPTVLLPVLTWLAGGTDLLLVQAVASLAACAAIAAWRPCATWAAGALAAPPPPPVLSDRVLQGEVSVAERTHAHDAAGLRREQHRQ